MRADVGGSPASLFAEMVGLFRIGPDTFLLLRESYRRLGIEIARLGVEAPLWCE